VLTLEKKRDKEFARREAIDAELRHSAGMPAKGTGSWDPVSYVTDKFAAKFNESGRAAVRRRAAGERGREEDRGEPGAARSAGQAERVDTMAERYQLTGRQYAEGDFVHRFGKLAFENGEMSAGIMQGRGKLVLLSTMQKAIGVSMPTNERQQKLWGDASLHRNVSRTGAGVIVNRDEMKSAVGIVVDSINAGGNVLRAMRGSLAALDKAGDISTMRRLYPYLDTGADILHRDQYQRKLREMSLENSRDYTQKAVLEYGVRHHTAMIGRKEDMQRGLMNELDAIAATAWREQEALASENTVNWLYEQLVAFTAGETQPESPEGTDEPDEDGDKGEKDTQKDTQ